MAGRAVIITGKSNVLLNDTKNQNRRKTRHSGKSIRKWTTNHSILRVCTHRAQNNKKYSLNRGTTYRDQPNKAKIKQAQNNHTLTSINTRRNQHHFPTHTLAYTEEEMKVLKQTLSNHDVHVHTKTHTRKIRATKAIWLSSRYETHVQSHTHRLHKYTKTQTPILTLHEKH